MTVKALTPVRMNLVAPLAHKATDRHTTDTAARLTINCIANNARSMWASERFDSIKPACYTPAVSSKKGLIGCGSPMARGAKPHPARFAAFSFLAPLGGPNGRARALPVTLRVPRSSTPVRAAAQCGSWSAVVHQAQLEINMASNPPIGARAGALSISSYRHTNWRKDGPPPLIVNPQADLHSLLAWAWGEARDVEEITQEFLSAQDATADALANILFSRLPVLVEMLEFLAEQSFDGELRS